VSAKRGRSDPKRLTRRQALDAVPVPNPGIGVEEDDEGRVRLMVPQNIGHAARFVARILHLPTDLTKPVLLDEMGTFVWKACDGRRAVRDIIALFVERYRLSRREAELAVTTFLKQLARRRYIALAVFPSRSPEEASR